jgi:hypothetical protein
MAHGSTRFSFLAGIVMLLLASAAAPASAQGFTGTWQNELGSYLVIQSSNPLIGYYINMAPNTNCRGVTYPIMGSVTGNTIVWSVNWMGPLNCYSQTSWTGFLYNGKIVTLWNLVINGTSSTSQIRQGSDTFTKISQIEFESFLQEAP